MRGPLFWETTIRVLRFRAYLAGHGELLNRLSLGTSGVVEWLSPVTRAKKIKLYYGDQKKLRRLNNLVSAKQVQVYKYTDRVPWLSDTDP